MGQATDYDAEGFNDFFSENDGVKEPTILSDGTSVQFPKGWTDEDADKWRKGMELQRPNVHNALAKVLIPTAVWYQSDR